MLVILIKYVTKQVQIEDELWMRIAKQSFSSYESCFDLQFQINHLRSMRLNVRL